MDDCILRKDVKRTLQGIINLYRTTYTSQVRGDVAEFCLKKVMSIPAADVQPVRRGRWIENESKRETHGTLTRKYWNCEECGIEICSTLPVFDLNAWHYCPNCGAAMAHVSAEE